MFNDFGDKHFVANRLEQHIHFLLFVAHYLAFAKAGMNNGAAQGKGL